VLKLSTPDVGVLCQNGGSPPACFCVYTPGKTVTVTNVGGAPLDIGTITLRDGATGFSQTNSCAATLDTAQACQIVVQFRPPQSALHTFGDNVIISDNATDSPQSVSLGATTFCASP
jgi:hypothetical protein